MKLFRAFCLLVVLTTLGLFAGPPSAAARDETAGLAGASAETQQLRKEIEALRQRVEQMERLRAAGPERPVGDSGEKARLLAETQEILTRYRSAKAAAWKQAHARVRELRREVTTVLEEMQADYTRRARLDEAVAIRDAIRCLAAGGRAVQTDPGRLAVSATSEVLFFRVTGANSGSLYGTGVYTSDSNLATTAVHAGILKVGQTGIVKVTTFPGYPQYIGSTQNGITSSSWGSYPGFRVEALDDEDLDLAENESLPASATTPLPLPICAPPKAAPATPDVFAAASKPSGPAGVTWPAGLPPEAREQLEGHLAAVVELRQEIRNTVAGLATEAVNRLTPIQEAHTRAARLDEAIAVRELIRELRP